jgi:hypothetical protein
MDSVNYIISTHAKCFDGAAAAAILQLYCETHRYKHSTVPHAWGRSFLKEYGPYLQTTQPVVILMFDVAPDQGLIEYIMANPHVTLICGDHHLGMQPFMQKLIQLRHPQITIRFDNTISGAQLALEWVASICAVESLGMVLDTPGCPASKLLNVICKADLWQHKSVPEWDAVDAALRMMHTPDAVTIKRLLCDPGGYAMLLQAGPVCVHIRDTLSKDLLQRGKTYRLTARALGLLRAAGCMLADDCTVFYVQGIPHLTPEMAHLHTISDMIWIWSKIECTPFKKYTVSVRRGRESQLRCDVVANVLGGGNGHAEAAGMAFEAEPLSWFL